MSIGLSNALRIDRPAARRAVLAAIIAAGGMAVSGGCAKNSSRDWAQTSPVLSAERSGELEPESPHYGG